MPSYAGGKNAAGVPQRLINQIPPHDVYVAVCLGNDGIMRHKRPAGRNVGIDLDPATLALWKPGDVPALELYQCDGLEWLKHEFRLYRVDRQPPFSAAVSRDNRQAARVAENGGEGLPPGGVAESRDSGSQYFVYVDPPYPRSTRRSKAALYRHEWDDAKHDELLDVVRRLPCRVMVSSYWSERYAEALADWRTIKFRSQTRRGPATEWVWMNYGDPTELHDTRFLGRNKRQREAFRRRAKNLSARLKRLPPLERQALIDAITGR